MPFTASSALAVGETLSGLETVRRGHEAVRRQITAMVETSSPLRSNGWRPAGPSPPISAPCRAVAEVLFGRQPEADVGRSAFLFTHIPAATNVMIRKTPTGSCATSSPLYFR
ncbi:MAG: hypothetical protein H6891_11485 [Brucellaceae bacterium]|nr:hypothetical protein [Brucellaceae bacterium]